MTARARIAGAVLALVLALPASIASAQLSEQNAFVLGNVEFALLHELAHVVIGDNDVPLLGPLESAADYVAIAMAIRGDGSDAASAFLGQALRDSATAFATTWRLAENADVALPYWDVHALGIQRYYAAICLIYGSDPDGNRALRAELPDGRAMSCATEYQMAARGLDLLIDSYGVADATPPSVTFEYGSVASRQQARLVASLRDVNLLENTVNAVLGLFPPKAPLQVVARSCGRPEAAWQPERRELVICYELLTAFAGIHRKAQRLAGPSR